jgi:hypothetical protein
MHSKRGLSKLQPIKILFLILIVAMLVIASKYVWLPIFKNTSFYNQARKYYYNNTWVTSTSQRAKFSFKHPINWPVSYASDEQLKQNNIDLIDGKLVQTDNEIENIDFEEKWIRNAGGPRLGYIIVEKTNYKNLEEYIDDVSKEKVVEMFVRGKNEKVTFKPPKIEYLKIGGVDAIGLTDTNNFATFSSAATDYRLIRNGWLYTFTTINNPRVFENEKGNTEVFQQILQSLRFFD